MRNKKRLCLILTLAAVVAVNLLAYLLPYRAAHPDVSGTGVYTLSDSTHQMLSAINRDAEITYFAANPDPDLRSFLLLYRSSHVTVRVAAPESEAADQTVRIRCGERTRTLSLPDLYYSSSSTTGELLSLAEYARISAYLAQLDTSGDQYKMFVYYYGPDAMKTYFAGDAVVSAALRNLTSDAAQTLWVLTGNVGNEPDWYVSLRMEQYGFLPETVDSPAKLPAGALLWFSPKADLSEAQAAELSAFLAGGGRLLLTTNYQKTDLTNLGTILAAYGLSTAAVPNLVADTVSSGSGSSVSQTFQAVSASHAINEAFSGRVTVSYAHRIGIAETEGVTNAELLRTSLSGAYAEQDGESTKNEQGCFSLAATAIKGESRVVWIGMQFSAALDSYSGGKDSAFAAACLSWLAGVDGGLSPVGQANEIPSALLNVKVTTFSVWIVIFVVLIPLALLAVALVRRYIREKK